MPTNTKYLVFGASFSAPPNRKKKKKQLAGSNYQECMRQRFRRITHRNPDNYRGIVPISERFSTEKEDCQITAILQFWTKQIHKILKKN